MGTGLMLILVIVLLSLFAVMSVVGIYNALVTLRNRYKNAYSQIDVQLKRRYDLIPNLVETAKGYLAHERGTLEAVITARNAAVTANTRAAKNPGDASAMKELSGAESALTGVLGRLFALSEAYPDLKANTTMMRLMEELTSTENKVSFARQAYNDSVMTYNTRREVFPSNIIAGMFNFGPAELFVIDKPEQKEAPKVAFWDPPQNLFRERSCSAKRNISDYFPGQPHSRNSQRFFSVQNDSFWE
jgi:LemA protein